VTKRSVGDFLNEFVLPLVAGGELVVSRPLSLDDIQHWTADLPHASEALVAVDDARHDALATLVCRPPALVLDGDELMLAAALHNVLFLVHPRAEAWTVSQRARRRLIDLSLHMAAQPLSRNRRRVLARHALFHNLFDISRTDVKVSWWTGSKRFLGQRPPPRLTAWRGVRRVREESSVAGYDELLASAEAAPVMATLLRRTPLTQLLGNHTSAPALHWEDATFLLRDVELARAVAYEAVRPPEPRAQVATAARYAAAFEQMLERSPAEADLRAVASFLVYLNVLLALGEIRQRDLRAKSALIATVLAPERAGQRPRGLATFFALPSALALVDARLGVPPGLAEEPALAQRWAMQRAQVVEGVGEAVIETLAQRLRRHLVGALAGGVALALPAPVDAAQPVEVPGEPG
jgi:hypothetical protein